MEGNVLAYLDREERCDGLETSVCPVNCGEVVLIVHRDRLDL